MKLVVFFLAASALLTAAANPMIMSFGSPSAPLDPNHVPKVVFGQAAMTSKDRKSVKNMIIDHYKGLEPDDEHRQARLAYAKIGWRDGKGPDDEHKQYLDFDYHRGEHPDSVKIGPTVTFSRDRPTPEPHFANTVPEENKAEMAKEMVTKYKALPPDQARRVRSMRARGDWSEGPGLREQTQFKFHYSPVPSVRNELWDPVTIYRPMSFLIDDNVPPKEVPAIKKRIRKEHEKLDENHPLKKANYGVVTEGWKMDGGGVDKKRHVETVLYKVKDQLSDSAETDFEKIGRFDVPLRKGYRSDVSESSTRTRNQ